MKTKLSSLLIVVLLLFPVNLTFAQTEAPKEKKLNPQLSACLQQKMGGSIFEEIKSGSHKPTEQEKISGEECFVKFGQDMIGGQRDERKKNLDFSPETDKCLQQKLGADYKTKLQNAKSRDEGDKIMSQTKDCFGDHVKRGDKELPDSVRACVENTVGKAGAEKILKGEKPINEIAEKNKLESAGCFAGFNRGKQNDGDKNIPPDKKKCIEEIMGSVQVEPTDAQKEAVGKKCFADDRRGNEGGDDRPSLPKEVESCLRSAVGEGFKIKSPEKFSDDEREKANGCFRKNNFQPQGEKPGEKRPKNMNEETIKCVERVSGKSAQSREFDNDTKGKIDKECFGGRGGPNGQVRSNGEKIPNPKLSPESNDCEDKVAAGITEQLPAGEVEKRVNEQCYKGEHFGEAPQNDKGNNGPPTNANKVGLPTENDGNRPPPIIDNSQNREQPNNQSSDNGEYCQDNSVVCQEQSKN